jgi:hypothetical protein
MSAADGARTVDNTPYPSLGGAVVRDEARPQRRQPGDLFVTHAIGRAQVEVDAVLDSLRVPE